MKTYKAKSSANRAAKTMVVKYPEIVSFNVEEIDGEWSINIKVENEKYNKDLLKIANHIEPVTITKETKKAKKKTKRVYENSSSAPSPCSLVWSIAEEMGTEAKRKDVLARCVEEGVAFYTARTQYQKYKEALRGDIK